MANEYTTICEKLERDAVTGVVKTVHWRVNATDGATPEHKATVYGTVDLAPPAPGVAITPYASLTMDQVVGWTEEAIGIDRMTSYKAALDAQIAALIAPSTIVDSPPFAVASIAMTTMTLAASGTVTAPPVTTTTTATPAASGTSSSTTTATSGAV